MTYQEYKNFFGAVFEKDSDITENEFDLEKDRLVYELELAHITTLKKEVKEFWRNVEIKRFERELSQNFLSLNERKSLNERYFSKYELESRILYYGVTGRTFSPQSNDNEIIFSFLEIGGYQLLNCKELSFSTKNYMDKKILDLIEVSFHEKSQKYARIYGFGKIISNFEAKYNLK